MGDTKNRVEDTPLLLLSTVADFIRWRFAAICFVSLKVRLEERHPENLQVRFCKNVDIFL